MPTLPKKQQKQVDKVQAAVAAKRDEFLAEYNSMKTSQGVAVSLVPGSTADKLHKELIALREERNTLLQSLRAEGYDI